MKNFITILSVIFLLFVSPFDWSDFYLVDFSFLFKSFYLIFIFFILILFRNSIKIDLNILFVLVTQIFIFFILFYFDGFFLHLNTVVTLFAVILFAILLDSKLMNVDLFLKMFLILISLICLSVLISVILAYFGFFNVIELNSDTFLVGFSFTKDIILNNGERILFRPGGLFTEPGMLATFLIFSIFLNQITYNFKFLNILYILTGLVSMSFLFIIYFVVSMLFKIKFKLSFLLFILTLIYFVIIGYKFIDTNLTATVSSRLYNNGTFEFKNNRFPLLQEGYRNIFKIKLFGSSFSNLDTNVDIDATWIGFFFRYGLLSGFLLFIHNFLIFNFKKLTFKQFIIFLIICILFYQRPFIINFSYYLSLLLIRKYFKNDLILPRYK